MPKNVLSRFHYNNQNDFRNILIVINNEFQISEPIFYCLRLFLRLYLFLLIFHIKTLRRTVRAFLVNSGKLRFLMLKSRKTASVLVRLGSRLNEKLAFKRQNGKI